MGWRARLARLRRALAAAWLSLGNQVECPCCGGTYRRFLTAGPHPRPNCECPGCTSRERQRLLWLYLRDEGLFTSTKRLLHFAPEAGLKRHFESQPGLQYVTADLESALAAEHVDIQDLPFEDDSFDAFICSHVLEHVPDDRRGMAELHRVLEPGGRGIVLVPLHGGYEQTLEDPAISTPEQRLETYGHPEHLRLYGRDFAERLAGAGFVVEELDYAATLDEAARQRHALFPETIFVCRSGVG